MPKIHNHENCGCCHNVANIDRHQSEHCHHNDSVCSCHSHREINIKTEIVRIIISAIILIAVSMLPSNGVLRFVLFMVSYLIVGYGILKKAAESVIKREPFDENFLMAIATIGAIVLGEYTEGVAVMLFYRIGALFEGYALEKSRKNISALMDIRPDFANVEREDGKLVKVNPADVDIGSIVVVKPGERVPIDGVVLDGASSVDTSALTGESMPSDVGGGDEILSGTVNLTGVLKIKTTKKFGESTVSKILDLVENASSKKSQSEQFISKFALVYTPIVCYSALALAILPPVISMAVGIDANWGEWIYRALTFLVISCPCALVISIPLSFFAGIGGASRKGVLIKGSNYLETLSRVKCVMFDKTGTLTKGEFRVEGVYFNKMSSDKVLYYAALAESYSDHPISKSIKNVFSGELYRSKVTGVKEIAGYGVACKVGEKEVYVGNDKLMEMYGICYKKCMKAGTSVHIAIDGVYAGCILICDTIKEDAKNAVLLLKKMGIKNTVMLTGDNKITAKAVADEVGIDKFYSSLLPADKVRAVEAYINNMRKGEKLAYVGDGINDAPVLARADVGISMGTIGSDAAIEVSDIVLMDDNPIKIVYALRISKKCMNIVYENIYFSIGIKLVCLVLGALGVTNIWFAVFADVGVMVLSVLNAIRCLDTRKYKG